VVKVPPPEKPPTYEKDKNFTRRNVAGAAGGMLGVDYEDHRTPEQQAASPARTHVHAHDVAVIKEGTKEVAQKRPRRVIAAPKEEAEMILQDEDPNTREEKWKQRSKPVRARDRMTVDKDAPEKKRKPSWIQEEPPPEPEELDLEAIGGAIGDIGFPLDEQRAFIGDPRLTDPLAIKEALGSPVAYAKHCMILAEAFRTSTGATRAEGVAYLALMFAALGDRAFARQAIRELGYGTGIIDLYPLEVIEQLVESYPGLLVKVGFGTLFVRPRADSSLEMEAGVPSSLEYPGSLKIRGFAIKGGGRPGYAFEPRDQEGSYSLTIFSPGRFQLLISGVTRSGHTVIDRVEVVVRDGPDALLPWEEVEPVRDEAKVEAWPKPAPIPIDYERVLDLDEPPRREDSGTMLSSGERISRQQRDALTSASEETVEFLDDEEPPPEADLGLPSEDALSRAEASLLKLAVVLNTEDDDITGSD
jgi:hypothetical protein